LLPNPEAGNDRIYNKPETLQKCDVPRKPQKVRISKVRKLGITKETSYPSEWFGVFSKNVTYVVLHLEDERWIYGWPIEWPSEPGKGHFSLVQASWLTGTEQLELDGVKSILVQAEDVKMVEFMDKTWEQDNGKEIIESTTATT